MWRVQKNCEQKEKKIKKRVKRIFQKKMEEKWKIYRKNLRPELSYFI